MSTVTNNWHDYADQLKFADVPRPAGATEVHAWARWDEDTIYRTFDGTKRGVTGKVNANLWGWQHPDGSLSHTYILLDSRVEKEADGYAELTAAEARELAHDLLAAADELDGLR